MARTAAAILIATLQNWEWTSSLDFPATASRREMI
jgi:hypothetical protein